MLSVVRCVGVYHLSVQRRDRRDRSSRVAISTAVVLVHLLDSYDVLVVTLQPLHTCTTRHDMIWCLQRAHSIAQHTTSSHDSLSYLDFCDTGIHHRRQTHKPWLGIFRISAGADFAQSLQCSVVLRLLRLQVT